MTLRYLKDFIRSHPNMLFPAFDLQKKMQGKLFGWVRPLDREHHRLHGA